ncbi:MAG: glycoside hydrolase family 32 protein [Bacteroidales bacterium]|nr:glycoside hydrolase family 32 protein [Bacteroidales bacterium]
MNIQLKSERIFFLVIFLFGSLPFLNAQYYPHKNNTDYKEPYRGQYHFSPKSEWMNDINGLVYQGGKYHMIYQWGKEVRHGGYATSTDLLHWDDKGVALIPRKSFLPADAKRNVSGDQVYSGSAVVVSGLAAKKITGSEKEAIVAIYTGTAKGTCLAWSNGSGNTWHDYKANPVANLTEGDNPRDPRVFWYKPANKWIMAIYETGTTFYSSGDLLKWEYLSNIDFGFECPDIFQLPLDGNKQNKKWILMDANGSYLVGEFDGKTFNKDEGQNTFVMDDGPDFYAAQTFPVGNLPNDDDRVIQIAWMDHWNGGVGEQGWERNATFPVSLGLVSLNGQKRITRNPINEFSLLYENTKKWKNQLIPADTNLLEGIQSKKFELSLEVDLNETTALTFGIKVANRYIIYDVHNKKLESHELLPDASNHIRIKILIDWGQLEIFGNDGIFSYTQQFAFSPDHANMELFSDGKVKLVSMEFHELARIW